MKGALARADNEEADIRRYQLQQFEPDWGGWRVIVTAVEERALETQVRLLSWQTGRPLRIVDPDGRVIRELDPPGPVTPQVSNAPRERTAGRANVD